MKKITTIIILTMVIVNVFAQNLTNSYVMGQLPRTTDDFQKYKFDYKLECAQEVGFEYDIIVPQYSFDGTNIFPLERNGAPIKSIECEVNHNGEIIYKLNVGITSSGKIDAFSMQKAGNVKYQFGIDSWQQKEWADLGVIPCVPNSFLCWTSPAKNEKGLILSVGSELKYKYDSKDRVIEVRYLDDVFVYRYTYVGDSKKISTITVIKGDKKMSKVEYTWENDKIIKINCYWDKDSGYTRLEEKDYEKTYKYDSHNNITYIEFKSILGGWDRIIYEFDNNYNSKEQLVSQTVVYKRTDNYKQSHGQPEVRTTHTREYTYDEMGNWTRMVETKGGKQSVLQRRITYRQKEGVVDVDNIYDDEEVDTHATFGMNMRNALQKYQIPFDASFGMTQFNDLIINIRFIVEKDGNVSFFDEACANKSIGRKNVNDLVKDYIKSFSWVPATIGNKFVSSIVYLSWKYRYNVYYSEDGDRRSSFKYDILKDVTFTTKERESYINNLGIIKFQNTLSETNKGSIEAKRRLAQMYLSGEGTAKDTIKAIQTYFELAMNNDDYSRNKLCSFKNDILRNDMMIKKISQEYNPNLYNPNDSWNLLCCEAAAIGGNEDAINEMIDRYSNGKGVKKDNGKTISWLTKLADKGDTEAMIRIANIYLDESTDIFNESKGVEWFTKAAKLGNRTAINHLGYFYLNGVHVEKNKKLAKKILKGDIDILQ